MNGDKYEVASQTPSLSKAPAYRLVSWHHQASPSVIRVGPVPIGGGNPVIIASFAHLASADEGMEAARMARDLGAHLLRIPRTPPSPSPHDRTAPTDVVLDAAQAVRRASIPVVLETVSPSEVAQLCRYADMLEIGRHQMQNYPLLKAVGRCDKPVLLQRGPSATLEEWLLAAEYIVAHGNPNVVLCDGGVRTFDAAHPTLDLAALPHLKDLTHLPVVADPVSGAASHRHVPALAGAALAAGADGILWNPDPGWRAARPIPSAGAGSGGPASTDADGVARAGSTAHDGGGSSAQTGVDWNLEMMRLRRQIDRLDEQILGHLAKRFRIAEEIAALKRRCGLSVRQSARAAQVQMNYRLTGAALGMSAPFTSSLWALIHEEACRKEGVVVHSS
ncbi:chorismate mutase [Alicyclobacillus sp.]|uniref:chorismate mutase n=1 Tax=Alicyclobacillus sp. TaxID=61169 RepID=UPI0025BA206F|nr:chorismate mutase [Alicyclobacillus sp.]MCL6515314.1 chorismate mutase [Alicyclobacillus sp.]